MSDLPKLPFLALWSGGLVMKIKFCVCFSFYLLILDSFLSEKQLLVFH